MLETRSKSGRGTSSVFATLAAAAKPAPWTVQARPEDGLFDVRSGAVAVETGLPEPFARYIACLRNVSKALLDAADGRRPPRRQAGDLLREADAVMTAVRAEWVFVAPSLAGDVYFLHDCVRKVGDGTMSRADALFLDEAKLALDRFRRGAEDAVRGSRTPRVAPPIVIPRRKSKTLDVAAEYDGFAAAGTPLHALSGRHEVLERTIAMSNAIRKHMDFGVGHRVMDIGCGDANLLAAIAPSIAHGVGTVLTVRERDKLAAEPGLRSLEFAAASFADLSAVEGPFDRVVANGCIHFVRTRVAAERALRSIATLMPAKARLWVGELHGRDHVPRVFTSKRAALRHVRRRDGTGIALAFARHLWRRRHRADLIVEAPSGEFWHVEPDAFIALAERCGFAVEGVWSCRDLTGDTFYSLQERYSCLLVKS